MTTPPPGASDLYLTEELLAPEEREVRDRVRRFSDEHVRPVINGYWERAEFPFPLVPKLAELGAAAAPSRATGARGSARWPLGSSPWSSPAATGASAPSTASTRGWR